MPLGPLAFVLSSVATAFTGFVIALSAGIARSRKARAQLGEPLDRVPETGGAVTLRGTLTAGAPPCKRFEDGRDAAAATVEAVHGVGHAGVRAAELVLRVDRVPVRLEGRIRVTAGSHEVGGSGVRPRGPVLERIQAAAPELADVLVSGSSNVRLRSLSPGDRVRVAGVLRRSGTAHADAAKGYRDAGASWCLVPDPDAGADRPALRMAFEGAPGGPPVRRAAIGGAIVGLAAMLGPTAVAEIGTRSTAPQTAARAAVRSADPLDDVVRALEDGDFALASNRMPAPRDHERFEAEVHLLAGRLDRARASLAASVETRPAFAKREQCLADAIHAREGKTGSGLARASLREAALHGDGDQRAFCGLLFADLTPVEERGAILDALPPLDRRVLVRVQALLALEAGRVPPAYPREIGREPPPDVLLRRVPGVTHEGLLGVHLTEVMERVPAAPVNASFHALESARAAHVLSAIGDHEGAQRAWALASLHPGALDPVVIAALRVAIELRAGDRQAAIRHAAGIPAYDPTAQVARFLAGEICEPELSSSTAKELWMSAKEASDGRALAAELMRAGTSRDGDMLFLTAPAVTTGREELLAWVRSGNAKRVQHAQPPPHTPVDFLARLEDRRSIAASLGDPDLAAHLAARLQRARAALLRRDVAVLVHLIRFLPSVDE